MFRNFQLAKNFAKDLLAKNFANPKMKCSQCKTEVSDEYAFCLECGAPMGEAETVISPAKKVPVKKGKSNSVTMFFLLAGLAGVLAVAIMGLISYSSNENSRNRLTINPPTNVPAAVESTPLPVVKTPKAKTQKTIAEAPVQTPTLSPSAQVGNSQTIVNDTFRVGAGTFKYYPFTLDTESRLSCGFSASGGANDIEVVVIPANEFENYKNFGSFQSYYKSGYVPQGAFNMSLAPGAYLIIFNNSKALMTNKVVKAHVRSYPVSSN